MRAILTHSLIDKIIYWIMQKETRDLVLSMLLENTGIALMDSGGDNGRAWQRNASKDLTKEPEVSLDMPYRYTLKKDGEHVRSASTENELLHYLQRSTSYSWDHAFKHEGYTIEKEKVTSDDISITVSLYHYLPTVLELDELCREYNALEQPDWNSDIYGVSTAGKEWLDAHGFTAGNSWNSYNGEECISQTLQGTELARDGLGEGDYVLLQVHGGADVRGGYTDAKLFKYQAFQEFIDPCPRVYATLYREGCEPINLESADGGYGLVTVDGGEPVEILEGDTIEASL